MARNAAFIPMAAIAHLTLEVSPRHEDRWPVIVGRLVGWARHEKVELRDALVLVPFAQLLPLARRAFAQAGGWMPRIETTQTLALALGPVALAGEAEITFDVSIDTLSAVQLLRSQAWGAVWARRDVRGLERAAGCEIGRAHV